MLILSVITAPSLFLTPPCIAGAIQVAHGSLRSFDLSLLQHVLELIERPWNERHPTLSAILGGEEDLQTEEVLAYVESESPSLLMLFVDFLAKQDCQVRSFLSCFLCHSSFMFFLFVVLPFCRSSYEKWNNIPHYTQTETNGRGTLTD